MSSDYRVFAGLLQRVGNEGRYQRILIAILSVMSYTVGNTVTIGGYLFYQGTYTCSDLNQDQCKEYVCSLPQHQRDSYITQDGFISMFQTLGDYRCDPSDLHLIQSLIYLSAFACILACASVATRFEKKLIMIVLLSVDSLGLLLAIIMPSLPTIAIGIALDVLIKKMFVDLRSCMLVENVSESLRSRTNMFLYVFFSIGVTINGLIFKYIKSWKLIILIFQLLPVLIMLLAFIFFFVDSSFDLVVYCSPEITFQNLQYVAKINGKSDSHGLTLQEIRQIAQQYAQNQREKHNYSLSSLDLCRFKSLRLNFILSFMMHVGIQYEFTGIMIMLKNFAGDIFLNGIIFGSAQIFATLLCLVTIDHLRRTTTVMVLSLSGMFISIVLVLWFSCVGDEGCSSQTVTVQIIGLFILRFGSSISFNFFQQNTIELFPTQIRITALQTAVTGDLLAMVLMPLAQSWLASQNVSIIVTFILASGLTLLGSALLPETLNITPPQMITELEYKPQELLYFNHEDVPDY